MLFDSHAHLNFEAFKDDYRQVIKGCQENNVWMVNVGSQYETSRRAAEIAGKYEKGVWAAVGLHPIHVEDEIFDYQKYLELAKNPKVVAIGETGLDYAVFVRKQSERAQKRASAEAESEGGLQKIKEKQKEVFLKHLELAREVNKPLIIHCREAYNELVEILQSQEVRPPKITQYPGGRTSKYSGVIHCFSGNRQQAEQYLELGFLLGFTGIITYSSEYDKLIKDLPLEKILIETDCPYLAPFPYRGKRNEPAYVKHVAQKIAEIRGLSLEKVAEQTFQNTIQLFELSTQ